MNKNKQAPILLTLYDEINILYTLYKIQQEALEFCYEENSDYGHVIIFDTFISDKFEKLLKTFQKHVNN